MTRRVTSVCVLIAAVLLALPAAAAVHDPAISSNEPLPFPQDAQNEPTLALDRGGLENRGPLLVAGGNDYRDQGPCPGTSRCSFAPGVGISGVYFSDAKGMGWMTASYARNTTTNATLPRPIGTLPNFSSGQWSFGDPGAAAGPRPKSPSAPAFAWSNGTRFYYVTLAAAKPTRMPDRFITVSESDPVTTSQPPVWTKPTTVSRGTPSADKPAIWVDDAAQSAPQKPNPYFGTVYVCWTSFPTKSAASVALGGQIVFRRSVDGGTTWGAPQRLSATKPAAGQGCTIRTDSAGNVYVFWEERSLRIPKLGRVNNGVPCAKLFNARILMRRSIGGVNFGQAIVVTKVGEAGGYDRLQQRCTVDGVAGARTNSFPSVDIANGASDNTIALAWSDGIAGQVFVRTSHDLGTTWSSPLPASQTAAGAAAFPAVALSPDGRFIYVVYNAFLPASGKPGWQADTSSVRNTWGVVRNTRVPELEKGLNSADWVEVDGAQGDARASGGLRGGDKLTKLGIQGEFLGDYDAVVASNAGAWAAWTDASSTKDCSRVDGYRMTLVKSKWAKGEQPIVPDLITACPNEGMRRFGNTTLCSVFVPAGNAAEKPDCMGEPTPTGSP